MEQTGSQDALTGLGHRRAFTTVLERKDPGVGVLLADLCGLGAVDQAMGYRAGDEYLVLAAECLKEIAPERGALYRVEGSRFALLLPGADGECLSALAGELTGAFGRACPPWIGELGGGFATAWAESADGSLAETVEQAAAALRGQKPGR